MSDSRKRKFLPKYALLKGLQDKEAGAACLVDLSRNDFLRISVQIESVKILYSGKYGTTTYKQNLADLFAHFLETAPEEKLVGAHFDFIEKYSRQIFENSGGPNLYLGEIRHIFESRAISSKTWESHQNICKAMTHAPNLARLAFARYSCLAPESEDLSLMAKRALESATGYRAGPQTSSSQNYTLISSMIGPYQTLWYPEEYLIYQSFRKGETRESVEPVLELVRKSGDRSAIRSAEAFASMLFDPPNQFRSAFQKYWENRPVVVLGKQIAHQDSSRASKLFLAWEYRSTELGRVRQAN